MRISRAPGMLVMAVREAFRAQHMVEIARQLDPKIETMARSHSEEETALLEGDGIGKVFMGEHELALGMTRHILERAGS